MIKKCHRCAEVRKVGVTVKHLDMTIKHYICEVCVNKPKRRTYNKPPVKKNWAGEGITTVENKKGWDKLFINLLETHCVACDRVFQKHTKHHKYCSKACQRRVSREKRIIDNLTNTYADDSI